MWFRGSLGFFVFVSTFVPGATAPAAAQELALKAGVAISQFQTEGLERFGDSYASTAFGVHYRMPVGPIAFQPELYMVSRGARGPDASGEERLKLDYLEIPLLLVVPVRVGTLEPYAFGGPYIGLETRCRYAFEEGGLSTNLGCESTSDLFDRRALDYGFTVGAGAAHKLGSGRLMLEARHTQGLRDIYDGADDAEIRNRSVLILLGYTLDLNLGER